VSAWWWVLWLVPAVVAALVDLRTRRIPNRVVVPALLVVLAVSLWRGELASAAVGFTIAASVGVLARLLARGGFGMGDVKLLAYGGAAVGPGGIGLLLAGTAVAGGVAGLVALARSGRGSLLPYGPAITVGIALALIEGR
jgi:Flp pilus assembly protein protease CpaA